MAVTLRPLDLVHDRAAILGLLERNLGIAPDEARFEWLYQRNPCGTAWAWGVHDEGDRPVIGSASVFPRTMWVGDSVVACGQVGHFSVDAAHRSLGPALMLQRVTMEPVSRGLVRFCYDCPPHDQGMTTFRRLGIQEACELHRYARPLRTGRYVARTVGAGVAARGLTAVADTALRLRRRKPVPHGVKIDRHDARFEEEFSLLDERVGGRLGIRGQRTAEILNWRFRDDPGLHYDVFTARRDAVLVGFVAALLSGPDARVVDLFGPGDAAVDTALLEAVVDEARRRDVETVHALVCPGHEAEWTLRRAGFSFREVAVRVVAYAAPGAAPGAAPNRSDKWSIAYAEYMG